MLSFDIPDMEEKWDSLSEDTDNDNGDSDGYDEDSYDTWLAAFLKKGKIKVPVGGI
jgi:hypothetical protein